MALIRLLQRKPDGEIVFHEPTSGYVPAYAILSHTWGKEEVIFQDMEAGADMSKTMSKAGWRKIEFCAKQAAADGLQYFWVDTCCIDKKNAVELGAAINSMFRWYQNAARCYVYLSDVSKPDTGADDQRACEEAFRRSRWHTRGWTLQELIAPKLVDFFSLEGERLGSKLSLESEIHEITGIEKNALRGDALSNFSIKERMSWAQHRRTTIEEDGAYCLIGIFDVSMVPNYGERRDQAFRRLEEEIHKVYKGVDFEQFAVPLDLASFPEAAQFVAREKELSKMHELLHGHSSRSCVALHGLGGIGKTQLAITYARQHKEKYTAIFWLNANDEETLRLGFRDIAQQVLRHRPSTSVLASVDLDGDLDRVVNSVKDWFDLPMNTHWLMIYDNYDNPKISGGLDDSAVNLHQFLPRSDHGSIIITTRSSQVRLGHRIHVQNLQNLQDGLEILSNTSGRLGIKDDPDAAELVKELGGLPLALSTAGAYLKDVTISFSDYLRLYEASWLKLQTTSPQLESYEDRSLYTTWQITFDRIEQLNAASAKSLKQDAIGTTSNKSAENVRYGDSANAVAETWEASQNQLPQESVAADLQSVQRSVQFDDETVDQAMPGDHLATKSKRSVDDSGYGSASRPATLAESSEPAIQGNDLESHAAIKRDGTEVSEDQDLQSLASEIDDIGSRASDTTTRVGLTGQVLIGVFLAEHPQFRALCEKVLARIDKQRLAENLRRLLRSFHKNLMTEAKSESEKAVARLLQRRRGRLQISQRIIVRIETEQDPAEQDQNNDLGIEHKVSLENWLANVSAAPADLPEQKLDPEDSDEYPEPETQDEFPFTSELKQFLQQSKSFESLLRDFMLWLLPADLRQVLLSIPKSHIWVSQEQDDSMTNNVKAWVEDSTGVRWNWWPLEARKRTLWDGEVRLFWRCTCGTQQWIEISSEQHELVRGVLDLMDNTLLSPHRCRSRKMRVPPIAWVTDIFRTTPAAPPAASTSAAASRYIPSSLATSTFPSVPPGTQHSAALSNSSYQQTDPTTAAQVQTIARGPPNQVHSYILFGVQGGRRTMVPAQVPVYDWSTDSSVFRALRQCYQAQRGRLRLSFSIWRLEHCAVVKFNRLSVERMVREYRDLPRDQEYQYRPRAGDPDARNPPLSPHFFGVLYYACPVPCTKWIPHECSSPPNGDSAVTRLPKRTRGFQRDQTSQIWGLEAVLGVSAVHVIAYHIILVAGPFALFGWWVSTHPGDLQNAIVPSTIAGGAISFLWMISGILTSKDMDETRHV